MVRAGTPFQIFPGGGAKYNFLIFLLSKIPILVSNNRCSIASMH